MVVVTDANGCTFEDAVTLLAGGTLLCEIDTMINPTCAGYSNGSATVNAIGGDGNYTYSWSSSPVQTTATASGLPAGTYFVTITDGLGCSTTCMAMIIDPAPFSYTIQQTGNACAGSSQNVTIAVAGGTGAYTYLWSDGQTNATAIGLAPGNYVVLVTDENGCSLSVIVTVTATPAMSCNTHCTATTCGLDNGTIIANVFGGTAPYSYVWSDGQTNQTATGLAGGTYSVVITDANGCTTMCYGTVADPGTVVALPVVTDVTCNGGNDGSISVANVTGGQPPYTFQWSNAQNTAVATNLVAGTYAVTIIDANGCSFQTSATVAEPNPIVITPTSTNIACYGFNNGSASVSVSGGMFPYSYLWSNGMMTNTLSFLAPGTYYVTVSDFNNCTSTASVSILEPDSISCTINILSSDSCGNHNGSATITPTGGTAPYTYVWSNGQTTATGTGLQGGSNFVSIIDANGCQKSVCVKIPIIAGVDFALTATENRCTGDNNADINLTILSGGPATFMWSNGATTEDISNLIAGTYTVTVMGNGCTHMASITIDDPDPVVLATTATDVLCAGTNNGTATVTVTGGTAPYSFGWNTSPPQLAATAVGLAPGTYIVTVSDLYGCTATASATVNGSLNPLLVSGIITNVSCKGLSDGAIDISVSGGTSPYTYLWHDGSTMQDISGLSAGPFIVTVTDDVGCVVIFNGGAITEPALLVTSIVSIDVTCNGLNDGSASANAAGGTPPYSYVWSTSDTTQSIANLAPGNYVVTITDANGCSETAATSVGQPSPATPPALSVNSPVCPGDLVSLMASSGYATYSWVGPGGFASNLQNPQFNSTLANSGIFTLTVTDANGCTATSTVELIVDNCANVGDFVWIDLNGNGIFDSGEPAVGGVLVTLHDSTGAIVGTTVTDSTGMYLFTNVAPGDYYVTFGSIPGYVFTSTNPLGSQVTGTYGPGTTNTFTVGTTDVLTIDAGYLGTGTIGDYVWEDLNNNGLQDDGATGIDSVIVQLTWLGPDGILGTTDDVIYTDTTDANGAYQFNNLPMGNFEVMVLDGSGTVLDGLTNTTGGNTTTTTLPALNPIDLTQDFGYVDSVNVGDFTWIDLNGNGIFDSGEPAVGGVQVILYTSTGTAVDTMVTDSFGAYLFTDVLPGDYYVTFGPVPGYTYTTYNAGGSQVDGTNGPGSTPTFTVGTNDVLTIDAGYLGTGTIGDYVWEDLNNNGLQDDGPTGIDSVIVQLTWLGPDGILGTIDDVIYTDTTDANGLYLFSNLPMGNFEVMVLDGSGTVLDGLTNTTGGNTTTTTLTASNPIDLNQDFGYVDSVNVGDFTWVDLNGNGLFDSGEPAVGGVQVILYTSTGTAVDTMVTDSNGLYLFTDVLPGDYYVTFGSFAYTYTTYNAGGSQKMQLRVYSTLYCWNKRCFNHRCRLFRNRYNWRLCLGRPK